MAHTIYENFYLSNEVEDQFNSHLNLQQFCTVDNSLVGEPGMTRKINVYKATDGTEKLAMGAGNSKSIEVSYSPKEYKILLAQNRFEYFDEQAMTDPMLIPVGVRHMGTDMFNTVNKDIFAEFNKATLAVEAKTYGFGTFADAVAKLNLEQIEGVNIFGFVNAADMAAIRKALNEDLKYVESFARNGYVGTVAGVNLYTKKDAVAGTIIIGTKEAVTLFNKKGVEIEQITGDKRSESAANIRKNTIFSRKYYLAALTDATKAVKILKGTATATADTTVSEGKVYYAKTDNGYIVGKPKTNPKTEGFYEIA